MKSEIMLKLSDLAMPNLPVGPLTTHELQQTAIRAIEDAHRDFRRIGELKVTLQGEYVRISLSTDDRINPIDIAVTEIKAGRTSEGISILRFLHACTPDDSQVLYLLGSILSDLGDLESADAYLRRALEIQPNYPEALVSLGVILSRMKKTEVAIEILKRAVELDPNNAYAHRNLGACIAKLGQDYASAQIHLEQAVRLAPVDLPSWWALAGIYKSLGKNAAARNAWTKVVQLGPQSPLADYARALLKQL